MIRKTTVLLLMGLLLASVILAGCGASSGSSGGSAGNSASPGTNQTGAQSRGEPTTLTFWTYVAQHAEFFMDAADSWNQLYPDEPIEIKAETYPVEDMHSKLLISLQSGDGAPDIVDVNVAKFSDFMVGGEEVFVPLNDVIEPEKNSFLEAVLDIYKYNGNYYGIEYHVGAPMMFYNTEILDQAGVKVEDIVTWDDLHEAGKKVLQATGKPIITFEVNDTWSYYIMVGQRGGDFFDKQGNVIIDSEENEKTLEFILGMLEDGTAITTPGGWFHAEEYYGFMAKDGAASMLEAMWYMGRFTDYMPELAGKIRLAPPPLWDENSVYPVFGGTATSVTKQSKHQDLAVRFLAHAKISAEGAARIWNVLGFDPLRWDIWETDAMKQDNKFTQYFGNDIFDVVLEMKDRFHPTNITASPKFSLANSLVENELLFRVLGEKSATPAEGLKSIAEQLSK